jgi:hypothetical protein
VRGTPKGGGIHAVALTARTVAALRVHRERYPSDLRERVFREPGTGRALVTPTRVRDLWARARDATALDYPGSYSAGGSGGW